MKRRSAVAVFAFLVVSPLLARPLLAAGTWSLTGWLKQPRYLHSATLLLDGRVLVVGGSAEGLALDSFEIYDPATGAWTMPAASLHQARRTHTATLLPDGRVLVAGGRSWDGSQYVTLNSCEIFDSRTGTWTLSSATMAEGRSHHTATLLVDGRVLIVGGQDEERFLNTHEIYDPQTGSWTAGTQTLYEARLGHTATRLADGRVVVTGGSVRIGDSYEDLDSHETYDPVTDTWTMPAERLSSARRGHTATLLPDGRVLVAGGDGSSFSRTTFEILDPASGVWTMPAATLHESRVGHTATLLPDGRVLAAGGWLWTDPPTRCEMFDPGTGTWTAPAGTLSVDRSDHTATLLADGRVLIVGGRSDQAGWLSSAEIFTPAAGAWAMPAESLSVARHQHTATLLPDGRVLVVAGAGEGGAYLDSCEIYDPHTGAWTAGEELHVGRRRHSATLLAGGRVLVVGGEGGAGYLDSYEVFDPASGTWTLPAGLLHEVRYGHTATLLPDGRVLVAGGLSADMLPLDSFEIYDPDRGVWTMPTQRLNEDRYGHSATLLADGRVLVAGGYRMFLLGYRDSFELYDPVLGTWTLPGETMNKGRWVHTTNLLADGRVMATAGFRSGNLTSIELFDPTTGRWVMPRETLHQARSGHTATQLADGRVLVAGGAAEGSTYLDSVEIYDPGAGAWTTTDSLRQPRLHHTATLLPDGRVLVVAGKSRQGYSEILLDSFEIYTASAHPVESRRPSISSVTAAAPSGAPGPDEPISEIGPVSITGIGFGGDSEASGGTSRSSPVNYPLTRLRAVESERRFWLIPDPLLYFSADAMTLTFSQLPAGLDAGQYYLSVIGSGVPSVARLVEVACGGVRITTQPADVTTRVDSTAAFEVAAVGARDIAWQRCAVQQCRADDWVDIPGATGATYLTPPIVAADSGTRFRAEVRGSCGMRPDSCSETPAGCVTSRAATLTVQDNEDPVVSVVSPAGGDYWLLSPAGEAPANTELVVWEMSDNVRSCLVAISLWCSTDGGGSWFETPSGAGLPATIGLGGTCAYPGEETTSLLYTVPATPPSGVSGSLYRVEVTVTDHAGNTGHDASDPFFIVEANPESVRTLILANSARMESVMGVDTAALTSKLHQLADHPRVQGWVVDLDPVVYAALAALYDQWDADPGNPDRANQVLFGCHQPLSPGCGEERDGVHDVLLDLLEIYSGAEYVVLVGDDRILPLARLRDETTLLPESSYPAGGDIAPSSSTVAQALAADYYLSDDPLSVLDPVRAAELDDAIFIPDLAIGRLVESPEEMISTIATFISQDGALDLELLDPDTGHKVLVTGYDFLIDSSRIIRERWKNALGVSTSAASLAPVDGSLISADWDLASIGARRDELLIHLSGNDGTRYGVASLSGHASHFEEGVPSSDPYDVQGLEAVAINGTVNLAGSVVYAVGCHGGLPVPGSGVGDADHSLDLVQTFLAQGVVAYVANTGYGWGLRHGVGYSERLVEIATEELTGGGAVVIGDAVRRSKQRYYLETPRFDAYDAKSMMQWTLFGLPMYAVRTGIERGSSGRILSQRIAASGVTASSIETERLGLVEVRRRLTAPSDAAAKSLPPHLTRLDLHFDLTAPGVYRKRSASGDELPDTPGCPDPQGCYYTLHGLVERGTGASDLPIQPYLIYDSRLAGTSQHGVLWKGGTFEQESGWVPVIGELVSNGGDASDHGATPRKAIIKPAGRRVLGGADPADCRPSDLELNGLVLTAGEAVKEGLQSTYSIERRYREIDLEVLYYNNSQDGVGNCDRSGPLLGPGPFDGAYHRRNGDAVEWTVPAHDEGGVWRVLVVYTDNSLDADDRGGWLPLELADDGLGTWQGSLRLETGSSLTYVVEAVDRRGNVSWLDWVASELPASGVPHGVALPVEVSSQEPRRPSGRVGH